MWASANAFTFAAPGSLKVTGNVRNAGTGAVTLVAGWDGHTVGTAAQLQSANASLRKQVEETRAARSAAQASEAQFRAIFDGAYELIGMIKASALAAIVTLLDLMGQTRFIFARTFDFSIYLYAAIIYLAITEAISRVWNWIERLLSRHLLDGKATPHAATGRMKMSGTALQSVAVTNPEGFATAIVPLRPRSQMPCAVPRMALFSIQPVANAPGTTVAWAPAPPTGIAGLTPVPKSH